MYASDHQIVQEVEKDVSDLIDRIQKKLEGRSDLTFVFISDKLLPHLETITTLLNTELKSRALLGCTAETVLEGPLELEGEPAIAIFSAVFPRDVFPDIKIVPFHLEFGRTGKKIVCTGFPEEISSENLDRTAMFLLGEPLSSSVETALAMLKKTAPGLNVFGGMASGMNQNGTSSNKLIFDNLLLNRGTIGVLIKNGPRIVPIVSQGCRPIGKPFIITRAEVNLIEELGGLPVLEQLQDVIDAQPEEMKEAIHNGLHLGLVFNEYQDSFQRGDFLITNIMGIEPNKKLLAIGHRVRIGQTVQFHVRDQTTATEDLKILTQEHLAKSSSKVAASLLFSCNGRGTRLFSEPNHDANLISTCYDDPALAGFFAQGEIGPVKGVNHMHGFTASLALFLEEA